MHRCVENIYIVFNNVIIKGCIKVWVLKIVLFVLFSTIIIMRCYLHVEISFCHFKMH